MNKILLEYIKTCRDAGFSDSAIIEQLKQVGWSEREIAKNIAKKKKGKLTFPKLKFPNFKSAKKPIPLGMLKGKFSGVKLNRVKPNFSFLLKPKTKAKKIIKPAVKEEEIVTTAPENNQVVMGPDGHKYYVHFYPVPAQLEDNIQVSNPMQQVMQQPYYIPMPGNPINNPAGLPYYPYQMPYPMYGQAQFMQMGNGMPPQMPPQMMVNQYNQRENPKKKDSGFWHKFDIARRVALIVGLLFVVIYVASYFLQLREEASQFNANADVKTIENMAILREKFEQYYQKNKKLPSTLKEVDSKGEYTMNTQSSQSYDYKIISSTNFHLCTVFNQGGDTYTKGYVCQPYEVNTLGMVAAGLPINPAEKTAELPQTGSLKEYPGCSNPIALLKENPECEASDHTNCRRPQQTQEFGMSSVALSNSKDRIAQTFKLPTKAAASMVTQFDPYIIDASSSGTACVAIYETEFDNEPLSGKVLAEYSINLGSLKKGEYNSLFIDPLALSEDKTYSFVFSLMDDKSVLTFARGMELSSYYDGSAFYLKRPLEECTENCEPVEWINREDDLRFKIRFY